MSGRETYPEVPLPGGNSRIARMDIGYDADDELRIGERSACLTNQLLCTEESYHATFDDCQKGWGIDRGHSIIDILIQCFGVVWTMKVNESLGDVEREVHLLVVGLVDCSVKHLGERNSYLEGQTQRLPRWLWGCVDCVFWARVSGGHGQKR